MYKFFFKRLIDIVLSLLGIIILLPVYIILWILIRIKLGGPAIFKQRRPGKNEKIFTLYKFRSMTNEKDSEGNLLPDEVRLTKFGKKLRSTSLDELPSLFNILKGDISIIGPRPQLIEDMYFMTEEQRKRHNVRPGLTGLAQVNGRNSIDWDKRLAYDLEYVKKITFLKDAKIFFQTIFKVFKREGISEDGIDTSTNLAEYLLENKKITHEEYIRKKSEIL